MVWSWDCRRVLCVLGVLLMMTGSVSAASSGRLPYCSIASNRMYGRGSNVMPWVQAPVNAAFYTIRSADTPANPITSIPASDPTTYIPNTWIPIHIRVHDLDKKFIGLVIYATNGAVNGAGQTSRDGTQVGTWKTTADLPFWAPPTCGGTAMTHMDADIKPLHSVLYWRAPSGTGRVSFHVIIKQGEQGKGNFYYPQFTLTLNEAAVPATPNSLLVEGRTLTSCTATCQAHPTHTVCDATSTGISSAATLSSLLTTAGQGQSICRPQLVSGCMATSPQRQPDDICSYKASQSDCQAQGRAYQVTTCNDVSTRNDTNRFCVCTRPSTSGTTTSPGSTTTSRPATNSPTSGPKPITYKGVWVQYAGFDSYVGQDAMRLPGASVATAQSTALSSGYAGFTYCAGFTAAYMRTQSVTDLVTDKFANNYGCDLWVYQQDSTTGAATSSPSTTTAPPGATLPPNDNTNTNTTDSDPSTTSVPTDIPSQDSNPTSKTPTIRPNPIIGAGGTNAPRLGTASSRYGSSLLPLQIILTITTFLLSGSRHAGLMVLLVCGVFTTPMVSAHNFPMSPSRALSASVTRPCIKRVSPFPHIQVIPGQPFPMEWSVGHGDSGTKNTYWVLVHENDYAQLNNFEDSVAEDYIRMAPQSAYIYPVTGVGSKWAKRHVAPTAPSTPMNTNNYFDRVAPSTEANYVTRDAIYREKSIFHTSDPAKINQWVFRADRTTGDVRVAYRSAKYPWIRAIHKFVNVFAEHQPYADQADIANFDVPANSEPGSYIYHYKWGGYRDCVDLDVRVSTNGPVALPFGKNKVDALAQAGGVAPFVKIDHCEFSFILNPMTQCRILPRKADGTVDASQCVQECTGIAYNQYYTCTGVQIVRATNPPMVTLPYTPNIPYYKFNNDRTGFNGPCDYNSIHEREKAGCRVQAPEKFYDTAKTNPEAGYSCSANFLKPKLRNDDYICYGAMPLHDENLQTVEDYVIVDDPADPKYYSTCIIRIEPGGFLPVTSPPPKTTPKWAVGDQCMSCSFRDNLSKVGVFSSPIWPDSFTNTCRNCDEPTL